MKQPILSKFTTRLLQLLIVVCVFSSVFLAYNKQEDNNASKTTTVDSFEKAETNSTCDASTDALLRKSLNNFNCYLFLLNSDQPKNALTNEYVILSDQLVTLSDTLFLNTQLHNDEIIIHKAIQPDLEAMISDAKSQNIDLKLFSAYRSIETQESYGDQLNTPVGRDENQTGFAVDFTSTSAPTSVFNTNFSQTKEGQYLIGNSYKFGFTLRYGSGHSASTGLPYEPWHYRYFGKEISKELHDKNISYEQWLSLKGINFK